jgi:hypothetical protein
MQENKAMNLKPAAEARNPQINTDGHGSSHGGWLHPAGGAAVLAPWPTSEFICVHPWFQLLFPK